MTLTRTAALAGLALLLAAAAPPVPEDQRVVPGSRPGFATDGQGGCWVWLSGLPAHVRNATASWTGACPEGPAEGQGRSVFRWEERGQDHVMTFEGTLRRGKAEGPGRLQQSIDGRVVRTEVGEYRDDHLAQGRLELPLADIIYEGGWGPLGPQGQGRLRSGRETFEGEWNQGCLQVPGGWVSFSRPVQQCEGAPT